MKKELFETLPEHIKEDIRNTLKAYDKCYVNFQNGEYKVTIAIGILSEYPKDFKVIGTIHNHDIYSREERIENYINEFMGYPFDYNGKKDWDLIEKMGTDKQFDFPNNKMYKWIGKLNEQGDFVLTEKIEISLL